MEPLLLLLPPLRRTGRRCPFCVVGVDADTRVCPRCARPLDAVRNTQRRRYYWRGAAYVLGLLLLLAWLFAWLDLG